MAWAWCELVIPSLESGCHGYHQCSVGMVESRCSYITMELISCTDRFSWILQKYMHVNYLWWYDRKN